MLALLAAAVTVIGFSPDGGKVAFIEHGLGSGSGHAYAVLHVYDVRKSADAEKPVEVRLDSADEDAAVAKARAAAKADGWSAAEVPMEEGGRLNNSDGAPLGTIEIKTKSAGPKERAKCEEPFQPLLVKLNILWMDDDKPQPIADEKKPPAERACAGECSVDKVYARGKSALILVKCSGQGYEGPDSKYSYYTRQLTYPLSE